MFNFYATPLKFEEPYIVVSTNDLMLEDLIKILHNDMLKIMHSDVM